MYAWWRRYDELVSDELHDWSAKASEKGGMPYVLPPPLYADKPIGVCVRCDALAGDPPRADLIHIPSGRSPFCPLYIKPHFHSFFFSTGVSLYAMRCVNALFNRCVRCDALAGDADHILRPLPFHKVHAHIHYIL